MVITPNAVGFDYFWGITASLDFPPYVWIENQSFVAPGDHHFSGSPFPAYLRSGEIAADFDHQLALDQITSKAVKYIEDRAKSKQPFFLYLPLTAPHKPVLPAARFVGKSGVGPYGDFVMQVDWVMGQIDQSLKRNNILQNTLLIISSDNGSFMYRLDAPESPKSASEKGEDHATDPKVHGYLSQTHRANGPLRGTKADVWDGGHRVPFIVRWPQQIEAASVCNQTISLVDVLATCLEAVDLVASNDAQDGSAGDSVVADCAEAVDSHSLIPLFRDPGAGWKRAPVIMHSANGTFAIRDGKWKLIDGRGSGGRGKRTATDLELDIQLYDMSADVGERRNLAVKEPQVVVDLQEKLRRIKAANASDG